MLTSYLHFRLQRLRDRRRTVPVGPAQDGQRRVRSPPKPRPPVSAVSPPRVQVGPGPLERAQVRVDALPEGLDGRKYSIRFVLFVRSKVTKCDAPIALKKYMQVFCCYRYFVLLCMYCDLQCRYYVLICTNYVDSMSFYVWSVS